MDIDGIGKRFPAGGFEANEHVVAEGDTLESVANQHGVTVDSLLKNNPGLQGTDVLQAGQRLQIPSPELASKSEISSDVVEAFQPTDFGSITGEAHMSKANTLNILHFRDISLARQDFNIMDQKVSIRNLDLSDFVKNFLSPGEAVSRKTGDPESFKYGPSPGEAESFKYGPAPGEAESFKYGPAPGEAESFKFSPRPDLTEALGLDPTIAEDEKEPPPQKDPPPDKKLSPIDIFSFAFLPDMGQAETSIALPEFDRGILVSVATQDPTEKPSGILLSPNQLEMDEGGGVTVNSDQFSQLVQSNVQDTESTDLHMKFLVVQNKQL